MTNVMICEMDPGKFNEEREWTASAAARLLEFFASRSQPETAIGDRGRRSSGPGGGEKKGSDLNLQHFILTCVEDLGVALCDPSCQLSSESATERCA